MKWRPSRAIKIGLLAAVGVFASLASGLYLPAGPATGWLQLGFAVAASALSGWLAAMQLGGTGEGAALEPAAARATPAPNHLPPGLPDFTNRDTQVAHVRAVLEQAGTGGLVVAKLTGTGGVGKTALAIHVARLASARFPDGQLYVDLRGVGDTAMTPDEALAGFLRDIGVPGEAIPEQLDARSRMFRGRTADRRMIVLLDNAANEAQIRPLLPGGSASVVLVTSRTPLAGLAASAVNVDVLDHEAARTLLTRVVGAERVDPEPEAATRIVELCGGLPLAVRIAGAKLVVKPHWTLAGFVDRLGDERRRLSELRAGDLEVRASFALSYRSLPEPEQHAFRLLGLLGGPDFAPWQLATLVGDGDENAAEDLLESLSEARLVEAGATRYRFHDLLRVFARERLADEVPDADRTRALHALFAETVRRTEVAEVPWIATEQAGLLAVLDQAGRHGVPEFVWRLAAAMTPYFEVRARWRDWDYAGRLALAAAQATGSRAGEATARQLIGRLHRHRGKLAEAAADLRQSLADFAALDDVPGQAGAQHHLGTILVNQGDLPDAVDRFAAARDMYRGLGDRHGEAEALRWLAHTYGMRGEFAQSIASFQESLPLYAGRGDRLGEARALRWLGDVYGDCDRFDEALDCFRRCLPVFRELADPLAEAWAMLDLGDVLREHGDLTEAMAQFTAASAIFRDYESASGNAGILLCLADVHREQGRLSEATACLDEAFTLYRQIGDPMGEAWARLCLADVHLARGERDEAVTVLGPALVVFQRTGRRLHEARVLERLGRHDEAAEIFRALGRVSDFE